MVPYKYDYRIYLLAKTLSCLRDQVKYRNQPKPLPPLGCLLQPQMDYVGIFNRNFQDVANYYNLITNEQKLDLLNYIITHNFYTFYETEEGDDILDQPEPIVMSEFTSDQIWSVISKHIEWFFLDEHPVLR